MSLSQLISDKSVHAAVSAIEVYNKPDFYFREEAFSLLMTNAWELLLKAKWLSDHNENLESLHVAKPDGKVRLNRSQNPVTFGITYLADKLFQDQNSGVTRSVHSNLSGLIEIRDNAVHFLNTDPTLGQRVMEIGMAAIQNYVLLSREWFQTDFSRYNFYLMPLSFYHGFESVVAASVSPPSEQVARLLTYLQSLDADESSENSGGPYVACRLQTQLVRAKDISAIEVRYTDDPNVPAMTMREEDVLKNHPLTYKTLTEQLQRRYIDFKANQQYHAVRKPLESFGKFCLIRELDPGNPKSAKTRRYNANILPEFDKHYTKRTKA